MSTKIAIEWASFMLSSVGVAMAGLTILVLTRDLPAQGASFQLASTFSHQTPLNKNHLQELPQALPIRLRIPKIAVDASLDSVGLTLDGAMDIPKSPDKAAWFKLGPSPGEKGSAVIAGHYGWKDGKAAAFDHVYKLRKGDTVTVENDTGAIMSFVVRESRRYDPLADASNVFGSNDGKAHLNLVTCEGVWNKESQSYSSRLVVFTDRVES